MEISKRAKLTPSSPIRRLYPLAEQARAKGKKLLQVNIGQPDIPTPPHALEAVRSFDEQVLAYSPSCGVPGLREKISSYLSGYDISLDPTQIIVTTGGSEAILFALASVCDPGQNVIVPEPFYANYRVFCSMLGLEIAPASTHLSSNFHIQGPGVLEEALTPAARAVLICNPSNPTGVVYTAQEMDMIARFAADHDLFVISDEVYREFRYEGEGYISPMHIKSLENRVIITDSISKRYSSCGARIGFLASRSPEVLEAAARFAMARLCPPTIEQKLAEVLFLTLPGYFSDMVDEYRRRRDAVVEELEGAEGIVVSRPEGAFYMIIKLAGVDTRDFARFLLTDFDEEGETVMVAPAEGFYATPGCGRDEIRIAYVLSPQKMKRAARIIKKAVAAYKAGEGKRAAAHPYPAPGKNRTV
ncbi:MAG: pyridoxal phosphate-dependent aminotransferase [Spirochaetota bacterium]